MRELFAKTKIKLENTKGSERNRRMKCMEKMEKYNFILIVLLLFNASLSNCSSAVKKEFTELWENEKVNGSSSKSKSLEWSLKNGDEKKRNGDEGGGESGGYPKPIKVTSTSNSKDSSPNTAKRKEESVEKSVESDSIENIQNKDNKTKKTYFVDSDFFLDPVETGSDYLIALADSPSASGENESDILNENEIEKSGDSSSTSTTENSNGDGESDGDPRKLTTIDSSNVALSKLALDNLKRIKQEKLGVQEEKLLLEYLTYGYDSRIRPVRNASKPVVIQVGITLTQIFDFDEKNQVLTTIVWLDQEWFDEFFQWDPANFGGIEQIRVTCEVLWLPDIVLYNSADDYTTGYMPSRAMVEHTGNVFWPPPVKLRSTCPVDVTYFPFDDQKCTLKLGSWTYNGFQVDVMNRTAEVDLTNFTPNGEWELLDADLVRNVVYYTCCNDPFPDVTITIRIRRKTLYYIYNVVLPCFMLSILTLLVFCLPPDSGEKIALGITVLLAFSVFMLAIAEKMPETSESIPLIGIYLTCVMAITSISVIGTVVVLNLHYLGPKVKPVPNYLKWLIPVQDQLTFIRGKSLFIPETHRDPRSGSLKRAHIFLTTPSQPRPIRRSYATQNQPEDDFPEHHLIEEGRRVNLNVREISQDDDEEDVDIVNASRNFSFDMGIVNKNARSLVVDELVGEGEGVGKNININKPNNYAQAQFNPCPESNSKRNQNQDFDLHNVQKELLKAIKTLIRKQEDVECQNVKVAEWRLVAQAVDRILFWIFLLITVVSSAVFLVILPLSKRNWYEYI